MGKRLPVPLTPRQHPANRGQAGRTLASPCYRPGLRTLTPERAGLNDDHGAPLKAVTRVQLPRSESEETAESLQRSESDQLEFPLAGLRIRRQPEHQRAGCTNMN
jgi:hypothetical protein